MTQPPTVPTLCHRVTSNDPTRTDTTRRTRNPRAAPGPSRCPLALRRYSERTRPGNPPATTYSPTTMAASSPSGRPQVPARVPPQRFAAPRRLHVAASRDPRAQSRGEPLATRHAPCSRSTRTSARMASEATSSGAPELRKASLMSANIPFKFGRKFNSEAAKGKIRNLPKRAAERYFCGAGGI